MRYIRELYVDKRHSNRKHFKRTWKTEITDLLIGFIVEGAVISVMELTSSVYVIVMTIRKLSIFDWTVQKLLPFR